MNHEPSAAANGVENFRLIQHQGQGSLKFLLIAQCDGLKSVLSLGQGTVSRLAPASRLGGN